MSTKPDDLGKQQEVLETLQKAGTLKRSTVVHVSPADQANDIASKTPNSDWKPLSLEERRVVLEDNTQIIVESQNEFIFVGPRNARIVLSCLPLFSNKTNHSSPLPNSLQPPPTPSSSKQKGNGWIKFSQSSLEQDPSDPPPEAPPLANEPIQEDVPIEQELPGDIFTLVDPFESDQSVGFNDIEESSRSQQIDDAFQKATKSGVGVAGAGDERGYSDSDDNTVDNEKLEINFVSDVRAVKTRAGSVSFVTINQAMKSSVLTPTVLPPAPPTLFPRYVERGGWLIKLSHQKGMFGDRWQKRYFILNGPKLSYFKRYGDSQPRGTINLIPGTWCRNIPQGTPRMFDAVAKTTRSGVISVNRCLAVHKPSNYAATLSALVASEGVADAFNSQTVALSNTQDSSRTFYMVASSEQERHAWIDAIMQNINAYMNSQEALDVACGELKNILKAVGCIVPAEVLPSILLAAHSRKDAVANIITAS